MKMVINILGIGSIIENRVKESLSLLMVISIKAIFQIIKKKDKESKFGQMEINIMDSG